MFRLGSSFNESCWELLDVVPCNGGHLAWLTDEVNTRYDACTNIIHCIIKLT